MPPWGSAGASSIARYSSRWPSGSRKYAIRELGGVFGVAVLASIFAHVGGFGTGKSFADGMHPALVIGAGVVALGALAAFMIPRRPRVTEALEAEPEPNGPARGRSLFLGSVIIASSQHDPAF
jgi:hypothetical protein